MQMPLHKDILEFALSLAEAAEAQIMPVYRNCTVNWKSDGSEVTEADRRAEEVMREIIGKQRPGDRVLGEEYGGPQEPTNDPLWVLDPVDGTASFAVGLPMPQAVRRLGRPLARRQSSALPRRPLPA